MIKCLGKLYFHTTFCYFRTIGAAITKIGVKIYTNFCYFRTIGAEITKYGVEIVLPNVYGNYWQSPAFRSLSPSSLSLNFEVGGSKATGSQLAYVCALLNSFTFPRSKSFEVISE